MLVHTDGRFSDIFGRKASLCLAMSIFMLGSILAGFSRTIVQLIVFRGLAGAGGGAIISVGQIVISDVVSLRDRCVMRSAVSLKICHPGRVNLLYACGTFIHTTESCPSLKD